MRKITTHSLHDVIKAYISLDTLILYLNNYRFSKYRATFKTGVNARYFICSGFLKTLFTYMLFKNKEEAAIKLQEHFPKYKIQALDWEAFICES